MSGPKFCCVGNTLLWAGKYFYLIKILLPRPKAKEVTEFMKFQKI
jgi:hypothetical protein